MNPVEAAASVISTLKRAPETKETPRRELLVGHIPYLFPRYAWQITEYALGAERTVEAVSRDGSKVTAAQIDTRKGPLLIEYKRNLRSSEQQSEAEGELKRYVAGIANEEGSAAVYKCISTDVLNWREYTPRIRPGAQQGRITPDDVALEPIGSYSFDKGDEEAFVSTVQRLIFGDVPIVATASLLVERFGLDSSIYEGVSASLRDAWKEARSTTQGALYLSLWSRYIQNAFSEKSTPNEDDYLNHAYLVILARAIAASALASSSELTERDFVKKAITGEFFLSAEHRVDHFVDDDFFRWVRNERTLRTLDPAITSIAEELQNIDFRSARKQNLLMGLYQKIMPPAERTQYGQVFTPTWLCERIVSEFKGIEHPGTKVLDPACGTGGFLRAVINRKLSAITEGQDMQKALESVLSDVCGFDINPVSVVISKTTLMLALADLLKVSKRPVEIPIHLCDSLFLPGNITPDSSETDLTIDFDGFELVLPSKIFGSGIAGFDKLVERADQLANLIVAHTVSDREAESALARDVGAICKESKLDSEESALTDESAQKLMREMKNRIQAGRNEVWSFVLKNTYRPSFLKSNFDIIVSNPPWLAMSAFPAAAYREQLKKLIGFYRITPFGQSKHHLEIATVFFLHCVRQYLKDGGRFGVVLPLVIKRGDQHNPFRQSSFRSQSPAEIERFWDLEAVSPLFGRPPCVVLGKKNTGAAGFDEVIPELVFSGNPYVGLTETKTQLTLSLFGSKSSLEESPANEVSLGPYWSAFNQGADLMPRRAVIVDLVGNKRASVLSIETSRAERENRNNKPPYDKMHLKGSIDSEFVFTTIKSDVVLPFVVGAPSYAALPLELVNGKFRILSIKDLALRGNKHALAWFRQVDKSLESLSGKRLDSWLTRRNKLVDQMSAPIRHLVLYGAGGSNTCAAVTSTTDAEFPFVNDQTLYAWSAPSENEAWYVCGMVNSRPVNERIKGHQPSGDFGEQHVHKLPLTIIPQFDASSDVHVRLTREARRLSGVVRELCAKDPGYMDTRKSLASRRLSLSRALETELGQLNELANAILDE